MCQRQCIGYDASWQRQRGPMQQHGVRMREAVRRALNEQEKDMSRKVLYGCVLVAVVAGCAKKEEVSYVEQPVSQEPVYTGKYK